MKIETEVKYYCLEPERLVKLAEKLKFKKVKEIEESDEYFTDIDSNFIKNRTCLRIRKKNKEKMEITYKGKSDSLMGKFCKLENNINIDISEYENVVSLFSSLGYYSYVEVNKKRSVYELSNKNYKYSIMIDSLSEIGGFVEFEIISEDNDKSELKRQLLDFVNKFSELNLKEATEPYRDIVAKNIYQKLITNKKILNLFINIDNELLKYEKEFYKKYKDEISKVCSLNIKWGEYKNNPTIDEKINVLLNQYLDNLIFDGNNLLASIKSLKQIPYEKYFITKTNKSFFEIFFSKLNIETKNVFYMKNSDTIFSTLQKNNIDIKETILINQDNFKDNISLLLILINETKSI